MKVGDLVKFSATGKKIKIFRSIASYDPIGIIVGSDTWIYVKWCGLGEIFHLGHRKKYLRQDLKYASR